MQKSNINEYNAREWFNNNALLTLFEEFASDNRFKIQEFLGE